MILGKPEVHDGKQRDFPLEMSHGIVIVFKSYDRRMTLCYFRLLTY